MGSSRRGVLALKAGCLSFKVQDPELGLFLQPLGAEEEWPHSFDGAPSERAVPEGERRIEFYPHIGSSKLQALLPAGLPPGRYGVRLVTRPPKCRLRVVETGVVMAVAKCEASALWGTSTDLIYVEIISHTIDWHGTRAEVVLARGV